MVANIQMDENFQICISCSCEEADNTGRILDIYIYIYMYEKYSYLDIMCITMTRYLILKRI